MTMRNLLALTGSLLFAGVISASAADTPAANTAQPATHSQESMTAGSHAMAGQKQHHMSDRVMPSQSRHCTEEALAKMPPDHRAACGK
jgi:hypothetical protein